ncbi:hypothetical protein Tco_0230209, partial [Tanacetum coccineum]
PKIDPKDKGKKIIEEEDESESDSNGIPEAEKKFKQLENDEEMARKIQEQGLKQIDFLLRSFKNKKERNLQLKKEQSSFMIQLMLKENSLLNKDQKLSRTDHQPRINKMNEDFISIGSVEDERLIKKMNEKGIDSSNNEMVNEEDKEEEGTKKRKGGHIKMIARKKARKQYDVDSDDEHKKCLKIVTFESILDSEIMEKKSVIARL